MKRNSIGSSNQQRPAISRRRLLGQAAGITVASSIATWPTASKANTPRRGGTLRQGLAGGSTTDSLDPGLVATTLTCNVNFQFGNCLIEMTPDSKAVPELAESFESTDAGKRWILKLRKGIQFHNGKEMTAADAVYSLNRHRGPNTTSATAQEMKIIEDIQVTSKHEISIALAGANFDFPYLLADLHMTIIPEGDQGTSGVGTGPYVLKEIKPGVRYFAERNPSYFKSDRAWFDAVDTLVINDAAARMAALQTGEVDIVNGVEPRAVSLIRRSPNIEVVNTQGRNFLYFPMHCNKAPFDNPDLRLSLKHAINREEMVKVILFGFGVIGNDHPITSAYPLAPNIPQRPFDLDKAAFHYKKSGFTGSVPIKIADAAFPGAIDAALLMQRSAAQAGINIEIERVPDDGYWDRVWNAEPFCGSQWSGRPTQDLMLSTAFFSGAPWNDSKWSRPDFDQLILSARSEQDEAKRKQTYHDAVVMVHEDAGHITPMFNDYLDGMSKRVAGFIKDPNFEMSGYKAAERCWFAD